MKRLYFFSSFLTAVLVEIPLVFMFTLSLIYDDFVTGGMRLYPLQAVLVFMILFTLLYFFRAITIDEEEIREIGLFSSRDNAMIQEGHTLIFTLCAKKRLKIALFGNDGQNAALEWLRDEEPRDIYLFRGRARGGISQVKRALRFFEVPEDVCDAFFTNDAYEGDFELVTVSSKKTEDIREVRIQLKPREGEI